MEKLFLVKVVNLKYEVKKNVNNYNKGRKSTIKKTTKMTIYHRNDIQRPQKMTLKRPRKISFKYTTKPGSLNAMQIFNYYINYPFITIMF